MTRLSINLNKVALIRNARGGQRPSVQHAAHICVDAGAEGITLHPRPDGRHALAEDVFELKEWLPVELNVEGNPFAEEEVVRGYHYPGFMEILRQAQPTQATLVPDAAHQRTSDHGWMLTKDERSRLRPVVDELKDAGCRVSLFMDPDLEAIERAAKLGADRIELYTEEYAKAFEDSRTEDVLPRYISAAEVAHDLGLGVNAGHDLDVENLGLFLQHVPHVLEVSIGQAIVADALEYGLAQTVRRYLKVIGQSSD